MNPQPIYELARLIKKIYMCFRVLKNPSNVWNYFVLEFPLNFYLFIFNFKIGKN